MHGGESCVSFLAHLPADVSLSALSATLPSCWSATARRPAFPSAVSPLLVWFQGVLILLEGV